MNSENFNLNLYEICFSLLKFKTPIIIYTEIMDNYLNIYVINVECQKILLWQQIA